MISEEIIQQAIERFKTGEYSITKLGLLFGVNRKTLAKEFRARNIKTLQRKASEYEDEIIDLANSGMNIKQISETLMFDRNTISVFLRRHGIHFASNCHEIHNKENDIIQDYLNGLSCRQLAEKYGKNVCSIKRMLNVHNVIDNSRTARKYIFNNNIFETIDTEEKAYWLGFLYADGYNDEEKGELEITLKISDKGHLENLSRYINSVPPILVKERVVNCNSKQLIVCRISIYSKKMSQDLSRHGCTQKKSFSIQYPYWIRSDLERHFIRGFMDGDGTVYISSNGSIHTGITSHLDFVNQFEDRMIELGLYNRRTKLSKTGKAFSSIHGGNKQHQKMFHYLYDNATVYLERKYKKFIAVYGRNAINNECGIKRGD